MALVDGSPASSGPPAGWGSLRQLTKYHWFVFFVVSTAWMADCMDQQLFVLARNDAMGDLVDKTGLDKKGISDAITNSGTFSTSLFLIGWATGGIFFGVLGDRIGRVKTLMWTIGLYSVFTGLSAFSTGVNDFALYRFLTGLGVGGVFAVAVALLAETMPTAARPYTLGLLQVLSTVGNCTAGLLYIILGTLEQNGALESLKPLNAWKIMFLVGIAPAILILFIQSRLKEPEAWVNAKKLRTEGKAPPMGSYSELFGNSRWRKHALLGLLLAFSGVVGLWGIGFFSPELTTVALKKSFSEQGLSDEAVSAKLKVWKGYTSIMLNIGAFFGMFAFSWITSYLGRKWTFAITLILAAGSTIFAFSNLRTQSDIFWMIPLMGFCQLALFGGYAIYLPELFPTRLRSTGTSFCYNVGRFVAASGPLVLGQLTTVVYKDSPEPFRVAAMTMCSVFALGLIALPFLPETKGKPLPE